jgi:hypothetical protein
MPRYVRDDGSFPRKQPCPASAGQRSGVLLSGDAQSASPSRILQARSGKIISAARRVWAAPDCSCRRPMAEDRLRDVCPRLAMLLVPARLTYEDSATRDAAGTRRSATGASAKGQVQTSPPFRNSELSVSTPELPLSRPWCSRPAAKPFPRKGGFPPPRAEMLRSRKAGVRRNRDGVRQVVTEQHFNR